MRTIIYLCFHLELLFELLFAVWRWSMSKERLEIGEISR